MKAIRVMAVLIIAGFAAVAQATPMSATGGYGGSATVTYTNLGGGLHEYQYDFFMDSWDVRYWEWFQLRFEFLDGGSAVDHILNMYDPGTGPELREYWTVNGITGNRGGAGWYGEARPGPQASYGDLDADVWILAPTQAQADAEGWIIDLGYSGIANPFHLPSDYARHAGNPLYEDTGDAMFGVYSGKPQDLDGDGYADDLFFQRPAPMLAHIFGSSEPQLMVTFRIVSDLGPYGEMTFNYYASGTTSTGPIVGPGVPEPATLSLLAFGGIAALIRRRRR